MTRTGVQVARVRREGAKDAADAAADVCPSCGGLTLVRRNGRLECSTCGAGDAQTAS